MKCPKCSNPENKVIDSRNVRDDTAIRRRRECSECGFRFTTYEDIQRSELSVQKHDGRIEDFQEPKLRNGISLAFRKRPFSSEAIESIVTDIYNDLLSKSDSSGTVRSSLIGEIVMEKLKNTDEVAYIRFASVYRKFKDVNEFMNELKNIIK